jgi:neurexin
VKSQKSKKIPKNQSHSQVEGNIFMVYNIGSHDLPLGDIGVKVNDNNYHVVRLTRNGANATLQIDDYNVQALIPQGLFTCYFSSSSDFCTFSK